MSERVLRRLVTASLLLLGASPPARASDFARGPYLQRLEPESADIFWVLRAAAGAAREPGGVRLVGPGGEIRHVAESAELPCRAAILAGERCYRVHLDGLEVDSEYRYQVLIGRSSRALGRERRFRTPPPVGEGVLSLAAFGDSGVGNADQHAMARRLDALAAEEPFHGILHTGDMVYLADLDDPEDPADIDDFDPVDPAIFQPYADLLASSCLFPSLGNHDVSGIPPAAGSILKTLAPPGQPPSSAPPRLYYSFDWGSAHFVVLDANLIAAGPAGQRPFRDDNPAREMLEFLCADLKAARDSRARWLIVVTHEPPFTAGLHAQDAAPHAGILAPIFDRFGVDLVLSGDDHNYQRSHPLRIPHRPNCGATELLPCEEAGERCYAVADLQPGPDFADVDGTVYVVSGGGGNFLHPELPDLLANGVRPDKGFRRRFVSAHHVLALRISPASLSVRAIGAAGNVIDRFGLHKLRLLRGDVDFDGRLAINDPIAVLEHLFLEEDLACPAAANADGDAMVSIADAIFVLRHLFLAGPPPGAPYPECGPLPEAKELLNRLDGAFCGAVGC